MFILCEERKRRTDDNHRSIKAVLDFIPEVPLNETCLLVFKEKLQQTQLDEKLLTEKNDDLKEEVKRNFGIENYIISDCHNSNDLTRLLLQAYGTKDDIKEKRCYSDFFLEKVPRVHFHDINPL